MSDLQIVLIAIGALIIAGVVVYNWLQERKLRNNINEEFIVPQKDVLAEDFYIDTDAYVDKALAGNPNKIKITEKLNQPTSTEPSAIDVVSPQVVSEGSDEIDDLLDDLASNGLADGEHALSSPAVASDLPLENVAFNQKQAFNHEDRILKQAVDEAFSGESKSPVAKALQTEVAPNAPSALPADIHPQIDLTAFLYTTKDIGSQSVNKLANDIASDMGVPMMVHGMCHDNKWHAVNQGTESERFKQIACSIQLADRGGPVSKHRLNKFQFAIENLGLELNAHVEWQGTGDAMQRAIDLDQFCIEVDQLISVHMAESGAPIHGTKLRGLAEANGMILLEDGKFHCFTEHNTDIIAYTLSSGDGQSFTSDGLRSNVVKTAVFQIEIPKVSNSDQVFQQVIQVAKKMSTSLNAALVDDHQKPLGDLQIEKIRQQLKKIHATMVARGIMPGSISSMRLFN